MNLPGSRVAVQQQQHEGLRRLLDTMLPDNAFYRGEFAHRVLQARLEASALWLRQTIGSLARLTRWLRQRLRSKKYSD